MRTYVGERSREGSTRMFVKVHGRRHAVRGASKDLGELILTDLYGKGYVEEDLARSHEFKETFILPRLDEGGSWTITEDEVEAWTAEYARRRRTRTATATAPPRPPLEPPPPAGESEPEAVAHEPPRQRPAGQATAPTVCVAVKWERGESSQAKVLYATPSIMLLEGEKPSGRMPPAGTLVRLQVSGERVLRTGRLAAAGQGDVYLVAMGSRAIRRSPRVRVDLQGTIRTRFLTGAAIVRVTDLSSGGARLSGIGLPIGADLDLTFTPPTGGAPRTLPAVVVRSTGRGGEAEVGVAFLMSALHFGTLAEQHR